VGKAKRYIARAIKEVLEEHPDTLLTAKQLAVPVSTKVGKTVSPHKIAGHLMWMNDDVVKKPTPSPWGGPIYVYGLKVFHGKA